MGKEHIAKHKEAQKRLSDLEEVRCDGFGGGGGGGSGAVLDVHVC